MLTEVAFSSTIETMKSFAYMCKIYQADKTIAVATAAIRNAANGAELVARVAEETGIQLHIISGNTEAYISYLGVINTINVKDGIIFDLGGGSTELILFKNRKILESVSLPIGAVNTTSMFNTRNVMPANVFSDVSFFIISRLEKYPWLKQNGLPLIGVGGTARTVAKIIQREKKYPATKIHNYSYTAQTYCSFFNRLRNTNLEQRKKFPASAVSVVISFWPALALSAAFWRQRVPKSSSPPAAACAKDCSSIIIPRKTTCPL